MASQLPPENLPPLPEPDGSLGPYAESGFKQLCGTTRNPWALKDYEAADWISTHECGVLTCAHPDSAGFIDEIRGFDHHMSIQQPDPRQWPLPRMIPRVVPSPSFPPFPVPAGWYAIDYEQLSISNKGLPEKEWVLNLRARFPEGSKLMLTFIGRHHELLEMMWNPDIGFWMHPLLDNFDAILTPEFSTFINDPRPQYMFGERQKQIFTEEGSAAGKLVIPTIAWSSDQSLQRQAELLGSLYPSLNTVVIDLLGANFKPGREAMAWTFSRLEGVRRHLAHLPFRFIISIGGSLGGWVCTELHEIFPHGNFLLLSSAPFQRTLKLGHLTKEEQTREFIRLCARAEEWAAGQELPPKRTAPEIPARMWGDPLQG